MKIALLIAICLLVVSCGNKSKPVSAKQYIRSYYDLNLRSDVVWSSIREIRRKDFGDGTLVIYITAKFTHLAERETIEIIVSNGELEQIVQITQNNKHHLWSESSITEHP